MSVFPPSLDRLVQIMSRLPGIGRKSATRIALKLVGSTEADCRELARAIVEAREKTFGCRVSDVIALERTSRFRGTYHVLGGLLSPLDGVGPEDLRMDSLAGRARGGEVTEVILALNPTAEGEATALYAARLLEPTAVRVTKLASGIPVGGDLDLADDLTLGIALEERREL